MGRRNRNFKRGFTLIEASLAMIIVSVGVVSSVRLFAACTVENRASNQMTTAMLLCGHIREAMVGLSFDDPIAGQTHYGPETGETLATYNDIDDFDGQSFSPPIDALRQPISGMSQYTQVISVVPVYPNKLNANTNSASPEITKGTYTGAVRVMVRILYKVKSTDVAQEVYRASWVRVDD